LSGIEKEKKKGEKNQSPPCGIKKKGGTNWWPGFLWRRPDLGEIINRPPGTIGGGFVFMKQDKILTRERRMAPGKVLRRGKGNGRGPTRGKKGPHGRKKKYIRKEGFFPFGKAPGGGAWVPEKGEKLFDMEKGGRPFQNE